MRKTFSWLGKIVLALFVFVGCFSIYILSIGPDPQQKPERQMKDIWANYPFTSHYVTVNGSRMHYIDEGDKRGPVYLFLHGNPTSSYLWRNIIPEVVESGARVIAVDNIGFGASDSPDIEYSFIDHTRYIESFIDILELQDITLVIHDVGSTLGSDYANRHKNNVSGIVLIGSILQVQVVTINDLDEGLRVLFYLLQTPVIGETLILAMNLFLQGLPEGLSEAEQRAYREPFPSWGSRLPLLTWPRQIQNYELLERVKAYANWLPQSSIPKLHLYVESGPGAISKQEVEEVEKHWENTTSHSLGEGGHFLQEDHPKAIGESIVKWYVSKNKG